MKEKANFSGSNTTASTATNNSIPQPISSNTTKPSTSETSITHVENRSGRRDGKRELTEEEAYDKLGYSFPTWRKWMILSVIFAIQVSMNFNAAVYPNVAQGLSDQFNISLQAARVGQMIFLVAYAFGSELWAPWSEELGRWPILQASLFLVNIWQIPCALAPNYGTIVVGRFLGGLSSAGGSVTLGMVADMWDADDQQFAVAFIVFSSVGGSSIGPVVGAFIQKYLSWHWNFWIQLMFGGFVQVVHFFFVSETRSSVLLDREAKRLRKAGQTDVYGPGELKEHRFEIKEVLATWARPFEMFAREPIVLCLSLLSGFSDGLIFCFMEAFTPVYSQWGFGTIELGLAFVPINIGYVLAYASYMYPIIKHRRIMKKDPTALSPESRLWWLLWTAPLEAIGLFGFAWTSFGPPRVPWIAPMLFSVLIAIANYCIYMSTIDYMVAAYGVYSASATGGNALARDFIAGVSAMYATPLYSNLGPHSLQWASTLLAFLAALVTIPIYVFYVKGPQIRAASKFAQTLAHERIEHKKHGGKGDVVSIGEKAQAGKLEEGV
ncbi:multidrug efflux pump of plasma membrane [Lentinula edodes]|uniref:Multidrug efflux pump of plasma membrane n=1 Tax=Lentinula lateritia TaxID=40482 RepID=A0A9W9B2N2_9AGAR|nr:multidrug efflux pump of plasma membrane [Lentinula edodes]